MPVMCNGQGHMSSLIFVNSLSSFSEVMLMPVISKASIMFFRVFDVSILPRPVCAWTALNLMILDFV